MRIPNSVRINQFLFILYYTIGIVFLSLLGFYLQIFLGFVLILITSTVLFSISSRLKIAPNSLRHWVSLSLKNIVGANTRYEDIRDFKKQMLASLLVDPNVKLGISALLAIICFMIRMIMPNDSDSVVFLIYLIINSSAIFLGYLISRI